MTNDKMPELLPCPLCYAPLADCILRGFIIKNDDQRWNTRAELHPAAKEPLNPDMPSDQLRLHIGELSSEEVLVARAAIRWANGISGKREGG